ncbi:MAG: hypothetical protein L3J68_00185 [Thermoplasmata archaeon]|nr:hypothetical protein [Thermoplasmata archaeon]
MSFEKGSVHIEIGWAELSQDSDPETRVMRLAIDEIQGKFHYADDEAQYVADDPGFQESCRNAVREARRRQYRLDRKAQPLPAGTVPNPAAQRFRVKITFPRPGTRGIFQRVLTED